MLIRAAKEEKRVCITYLKGKDEKSKRVIVPYSIADDEFAGHAFLALRAWCESRQAERTFNVERILRIEEIAP
ncbi:MAG: WYL domain-containing protein [bacterium]|nr:WYL domain-containing protein [bacterium]